MYEGYWGLREKPFENTPDPRFFYYSAKHKEALSRMLYAVREHKGAALLTGEYGCGKTLLSRTLLQEISKDRYRFALIFNPRIPTVGLLKEIVHQLGVNRPPQKKSLLLNKLNNILYHNYEQKLDTVILIDEAQAIKDDEIFEELRLLLNFQLNDRFLLTLIIIGQPELRERIDKIPQLKQRMSVTYHLGSLNIAETIEYIKHRLSVAGAQRDIFSSECYTLIYQGSEGIPRRINNICEMCLLVGFGKKTDVINEQLAKEVIADLEGQAVTR